MMAGYVSYMVRGKRLTLELGKTIWKGAVLPKVMYRVTGISVKEKHVESLDKWQRMV